MNRFHTIDDANICLDDEIHVKLRIHERIQNDAEKTLDFFFDEFILNESVMTKMQGIDSFCLTRKQQVGDQASFWITVRSFAGFWDNH
jgi:hypothetical protein